MGTIGNDEVASGERVELVDDRFRPSRPKSRRRDEVMLFATPKRASADHVVGMIRHEVMKSCSILHKCSQWASAGRWLHQYTMATHSRRLAVLALEEGLRNVPMYLLAARTSWPALSFFKCLYSLHSEHPHAADAAAT